jgi:hypothetical protein
VAIAYESELGKCRRLNPGPALTISQDADESSEIIIAEKRKFTEVPHQMKDSSLEAFEWQDV